MEIRRPEKISPDVEKSPACRVELLTYNTKLDCCKISKVLNRRDLVIMLLAVKRAPTSALQATPNEEKTERPPWTWSELKIAICPIVDWKL